MYAWREKSSENSNFVYPTISKFKPEIVCVDTTTNSIVSNCLAIVLAEIHYLILDTHTFQTNSLLS